MAGAVAVVIVAVIAWPSREPAPSSDAHGAVRSRRSRRDGHTARPLAADRSDASGSARWSRSAASPDRAIDIDLPDVVIAENEVKAYATLVSSIRRSRFDVAVPAAPDPNTPLEVKELPPVEPLEIEPIVKLATLQCEGERP